MMRLAVVIVVVMGFGALLFWGLNHVNPQTRANVRSAREAKPAPSFTLEVAEPYRAYGDTLGVNGTLDMPIILNFWASWCPPCREELPALERAWQRHQDSVLILGINTQERNSEAALALLREFRISYPNVYDANNRVGIDYGIYGLPETFFISRDGVVDYVYKGVLTDEILNTQITHLTQ